MKWTRKSGEIIDMKDMNDNHLHNATKMVERFIRTHLNEMPPAQDFEEALKLRSDYAHQRRLLKGLQEERARRENIKFNRLQTAAVSEFHSTKMSKLAAFFLGRRCSEDCGPHGGFVEMEKSIKFHFNNDPVLREFSRLAKIQAAEEALERAMFDDL